MSKPYLPNWWRAEGTCFETQPRNFWCRCLNALSSLTRWCLIVTNPVLQNVLTWHLDTFLLLGNWCYLHQHSLPFWKQKYHSRFLPPQNIRIIRIDTCLFGLISIHSTDPGNSLVPIDLGVTDRNFIFSHPHWLTTVTATNSLVTFNN